VPPDLTIRPALTAEEVIAAGGLFDAPARADAASS